MYVKGKKLQVVVFFRKGNSLCLGAQQSADRLGRIRNMIRTALNS